MPKKFSFKRHSTPTAPGGSQRSVVPTHAAVTVGCHHAPDGDQSSAGKKVPFRRSTSLSVDTLPAEEKSSVPTRRAMPMPPVRISSLTESALMESFCSIRTLTAGTLSLSPGYDSYRETLHLQLPTEYDNSSHDDLSADEAYEISSGCEKSSNWRKVRNVVQWTPFIQTYKRHKYPWVQLAGHQGNFKAGFRQGTILKKLCPAEEKAFEEISKDVLQPFVPEYLGVVEGPENERYLQLQDLLSDFGSPCVMDLKMGVRTYLEDELAKAREKPKLRKDMYEKMIQIDPDAPSPAENEAKAVTKPRYMVWRETISSTATLGFRIEGVRRGDGTSSKEFKTTRTKEQVLAALSNFLNGYPNAHAQYIQRLKAIRATLEVSPFFKTHELIGSSLLFVHNKSDASIWLIDFAKTVPLPEDVRISHREPWIEGSHEDGYLLGLNNLIELMIYLQQVLSHTQHGNFILKNTESAIGHVNNSSNVTTNQNITRQKPDTTLISSSEKSASSSNQSSKILETVTAIPAVSSSASSNSVLLRGTKPVSVSQGGVAL